LWKRQRDLYQSTVFFFTIVDLSQEMGSKLKQELMIAMKFHDVEKIE
jgi:hypothetical protein